jgi:hypothetical protein
MSLSIIAWVISISKFGTPALQLVPLTPSLTPPQLTDDPGSRRAQLLGHWRRQRTAAGE